MLKNFTRYLVLVHKNLFDIGLGHNKKINRTFPQTRRLYFTSSSVIKLLSNYQHKYFYVMSLQKPEVVFVLGGPGAGKGTQCQRIVEEFGFVHLSAGDLLREERSRPGSKMSELIEDCIKNGKIVPVEITCDLLDNAMQKYIKESGKNKFLIDGFPRNQDNLNGWNAKMSDKVDFLFVLFFDCNQDVCVDRCLTRGKAGSGRSDDNEESMKKRIETYTKDSLPIIQHYKNLNKVREIDASPNANEVFEKVKNVFKNCAIAGDNN